MSGEIAHFEVDFGGEFSASWLTAINLKPTFAAVPSNFRVNGWSIQVAAAQY
jgi:hypothetical protein